MINSALALNQKCLSSAAKSLAWASEENIVSCLKIKPKGDFTAKIKQMFNILVSLQVLSGLITAFFILIHEPKAEGLGSIGGSAHQFRGVRTSADDRLDNLTWFFAILFLLSSALLAFFFAKS